jgi:hypothetical protein
MTPRPRQHTRKSCCAGKGFHPFIAVVRQCGKQIGGEGVAIGHAGALLSMLIEARDGVVYVNGRRVDAAPAPASAASSCGRVAGAESSKLSETKNR